MYTLLYKNLGGYIYAVGTKKDLPIQMLTVELAVKRAKELGIRHMLCIQYFVADSEKGFG